ncbi:MAG: hypothetical protein KME60_07140 [Cyanomargarita calcarea GSE-NOS-MK-12-04C]|jgi:septal ring factor EnvC (AmiA/AmiB activator)|uniref:Uncharacterized protein n=1 Tax=Cyanomargarita calcarea GSE-NOS-MK-12-04C TaxID=2839659 RepID=A0A951QJ03_9CYAN|nr:hypothetical protein [Cyanomargarita calcarea GSE-NOS-MK-12-04C]
MGIMGTVLRTGTGGNDDSSHKRTYQGDHSLSTEATLKPTDDNVITPLNQNNWDSIRTQSVVVSPTYFNKEQAENLRTLAKQKKQEVTQTKRAYKSLKTLEKTDATVHTEHRNYQKTVAKCETDKQRSNASLARKLHQLRPEYVRMGRGIERAEAKADTRIAELRAKIEAAT